MSVFKMILFGVFFYHSSTAGRYSSVLQVISSCISYKQQHITSAPTIALLFHFIQIRVAGVDPSWMWTGRSHTHSHLRAILVSPVNVKCMLVAHGKKLEYLEKSHTHILGEYANSHGPINSGTIWFLQAETTNH